MLTVYILAYVQGCSRLVSQNKVSSPAQYSIPASCWRPHTVAYLVETLALGPVGENTQRKKLSKSGTPAGKTYTAAVNTPSVERRCHRGGRRLDGGLLMTLLTTMTNQPWRCAAPSRPDKGLVRDEWAIKTNVRAIDHRVVIPREETKCAEAIKKPRPVPRLPREPRRHERLRAGPVLSWSTSGACY